MKGSAVRVRASALGSKPKSGNPGRLVSPARLELALLDPQVARKGSMVAANPSEESGVLSLRFISMAKCRSASNKG